jgi:hypothetical protein
MSQKFVGENSSVGLDFDHIDCFPHAVNAKVWQRTEKNIPTVARSAIIVRLNEFANLTYTQTLADGIERTQPVN